MISEKSPRISVVMIDGSFRDSFHIIDFFGNQTMPAEDFELIWVEYFEKINPSLLNKVSKYLNFRVITLNNKNAYHSSSCFNAGIVGSKGELIIIPDADVAVEDNFLDTIWKEHQENEKLVMYFYRYDEPEDKHLPVINLGHLRSVCKLSNTTNYGGCLSLRKKWLLEINGYEQHQFFGSGFHANGLDVYTRLKNLGLHVKWHPQIRLYHPWHPLTLANSTSYDIQRAIIDYRAVNLFTLPFNGINKSFDSTPPRELMDKIELIGREHHERFQKRNLRLQSIFRKIFY